MFCAGLFSICRSPAFLFWVTLGHLPALACEYNSAGTAPEAPEPALPAMRPQYKESLAFSTPPATIQDLKTSSFVELLAGPNTARPVPATYTGSRCKRPPALLWFGLPQTTLYRSWA